MGPWMSQQEINTIVKYLKPDDVMLEYGCGGSTVFFCNYVREYYSVEHNREWYQKMLKQKKKNTTLFYVDRNEITPESNRIHASNWDELYSSSRYKDFRDYIHFPESLDKVFDVVLIDGRARPECSRFIFDYVKEGGIVFMHDYWARPRYHVAEEKYKVIDAVKTGQSLVVLRKV
jgi:hypothetical protein